MRSTRSLVVVALSSLILAACGGQTAQTPTAIPATVAPTSAPLPTAIPQPTAEPTVANLSADQIAAKLKQSTVLVRSEFPATPIEDAGLGAGTGIVLSDDGYIVTNAHVVQGASSWTVATSGSSTSRPARLIGASTCDDIAILKVDDTSDLAPAVLGSSSDIVVGEEVVALGYPESFDLGSSMSVTRGIVSQVNRQLENYDSLIQTDAAINHGNSGGPLVNKRGEVIGINSLGSSSATNINFSISIDKAKGVIEQLKKGTHPQWLGLNVVPNDYADYFGTEGGMVVVGVDSGSPAKKVDVQPADLLLQVEDTDINSMTDLCKILRSHSDGDQLKISVLRVGDGSSGLFSGEIAVSDTKAAVEPLKQVEVFTEPTAEPAADGSPTDTAGTTDSNVEYTNYDFQTDDGKWRTGENDDVKATVGGGLYSITLKTPELYTTWPALDFNDQQDMAVLADVQVKGNARAGVAARYVESGDQKSYYACWIDGNNQFGCVNYNNGQLTTLSEAATSEYITPGGKNTVTLVTEGTKVSFLINGGEVASFENTTLTHGVPALYVENFDDAAGADYSAVTVVTPKQQ